MVLIYLKLATQSLLVARYCALLRAYLSPGIVPWEHRKLKVLPCRNSS